MAKMFNKTEFFQELLKPINSNVYMSDYSCIARNFLHDYYKIEEVFRKNFTEIQYICADLGIDIQADKEYAYFKQLLEKEIGLYKLPREQYLELIERAISDAVELDENISIIEQNINSSTGFDKDKNLYLKEVNEKFKNEIVKYMMYDIKKEALNRCRNNPQGKLFHFMHQFVYQPYTYAHRGSFFPFSPDVCMEVRIKFMKLPISETLTLIETYKQCKGDGDYSEYLSFVTSYIVKMHIADSVVQQLDNECFFIRKNIVHEAIELYNGQKYDVFVNIIALQIEGLLLDFCDHVNLILSKGDTLVNKLDKINEQHPFWGYQYFRFDFPKLRNVIAHGKYIADEYNNKPLELIAHELLLDLNYLLSFLSEADTPIKQLMHNIEYLKENENDVDGIIIKDLYDSIHYQILIKVLKSICHNPLQAELLFFHSKDDILDFYGYIPLRDWMIGFLNNDKTIDMIIDGIEMNRSKYSTHDDKDFYNKSTYDKLIKLFSKNEVLKKHCSTISKAIYN